MVENTGSTARDFCMLERNILAHLKLALLLSLLSSSLLLQARLVPGQDNENQNPLRYLWHLSNSLPALAAVVGGVWEYYSGYWDLRKSRAFLIAVKPHLFIISTVTGIVFATCIVLLVQG
ncbi:hypothetical protein BJ912DRAFT_1053400 [Pholiota molesta]|nr:hypothetical protein BJ912DRAFT_1053400 [Pholiota molesta]